MSKEERIRQIEELERELDRIDLRRKELIEEIKRAIEDEDEA